MNGDRLALLLCGLLALCGCSTPSSSGAGGSAATTETYSRNLPGVKHPALGNLDEVGSNAQAWTASVFPVPAGDVVLSGWAVDGDAKVPASGVEVAVDGHLYPAQYGIARPDVARVQNVPAYGKSGFTCRLHAGDLAKGRHTVSIRVISADKKSYAELRSVTLDVQ